MKRNWVLALGLVLVLSLIVGCGAVTATTPVSSSNNSNTTSQKDPSNITFWYWEDLEGMHKELLSGPWNDQKTNITVKFESVPQSSYHDKLITAMSSNTSPEIFKMYPAWMSELVGMNGLYDLTDTVKTWDIMSQIPESEMAVAYAGQDKLYSLPFCSVVMYLYCRADFFKEVGLDYPKTMDDFYAACEKLTRDTDGDGKIDSYGFSLRGAKGGQDMWASLVLNSLKDADYVDANYQPMLDNPTLIEANDKYLNIFKNGWAPPTAPTDGFEQVVQNFKSGVAAMLIHHVGSSKGMVEALGSDKVAVVTIPEGAGGKYVPNIATSLGLYAKSKNLDSAITFAKWMTTPDVQDIICKNVVQTPWLPSVQTKAEYQNNQFHKISIDSLPFSKMAPVLPKMGQFTEKNWPQTMQRALLGEITSAEMMKTLNDSLK